MRSLIAGLRASGNGSAVMMTPTRMSTFMKSSKVMSAVMANSVGDLLCRGAAPTRRPWRRQLHAS
jgi:hypothetical protein